MYKSETSEFCERSEFYNHLADCQAAAGSQLRVQKIRRACKIRWFQICTLDLDFLYRVICICYVLVAKERE